MRLFSCLIRLALALFAAVALPNAAVAQSTVEGTIAFDERSVPMTHIYARQALGRDNTPGDVKILILDRAAPGAVAASQRAYYEAARQGQVQGLMLNLVSPDEARLIVFAPGGNMDDTLLPDMFSQIELTDLVREGNWVSGRLRTTEPLDLQPSGDGTGPTSYAVDLRFRAQIAPAPQPTEVLTGEAAQRSPQAAAATRLLALFRSGTPAEIRAALHPSHPAWDVLDSEEAAELLAAARQALPTPAAFAQSIESVTVYGDEAVIFSRDPQARTTASLRLVDGEWRAAAAPIPND